MYEKGEVNQIIEDFRPLILYYGKHFGGEEMNAELWAFLWELVAKGQAKNRHYVAVAIRNKFINYSKVLQKRALTEQPFDRLENAPKFQSFDTRIFLAELLRQLTDKQRRVLKLCEYCGYSIAEVAQMDGCSRQSVNAVRKRALDKIKCLL